MKLNILNSIAIIKRPALEYFAGICIVVIGSYMLANGIQYKLCLLIGFIISVIIACRHPLLIVSVHFILSIFPNLFLMAVDDPYSWRNLAKGIGVNDIVLCAMVTAVFLKFCPSMIKIHALERRHGVRSGLGASKYVIMFSIWLLFEIARNIEFYGLSAPENLDLIISFWPCLCILPSFLIRQRNV